MFTALATVPLDPLWALTAAFRADQRLNKLDLILGIYRDADGTTPVLKVVQDAERHLAGVAPSKAYRPLSGNFAFNEGVTRLLLGADCPFIERTVTIQTVGGTGALRMLGELIAAANPSATIWSSHPGYSNYRPLMVAAGLRFAEYPWRECNGEIDVELMLEVLGRAQKGDILLVQGCCHNPTGVDLSQSGWHILAELCEKRGIVPLVDIAYQGLGDGLDSDAWGLRYLCRRLGTVLVAASCSKNMSLYCERTGAAVVVLPTPKEVGPTRSVLEGIGRRTYSMAPDHGASIAAWLFENPAPWHAELDEIRNRIRNVRYKLAHALQSAGVHSELLALKHHRGMFSMLPFSPDQMTRLRSEHAIYGTSGGRINVAGILENRIDDLAQSLSEVSWTDDC